ncbi:MAG: glycosyltransferase family 2 protein [Chromatiaceae bacterium]|nr:glycosyltransferase family 2 protein [Chromatiaceae bacterium]
MLKAELPDLSIVSPVYLAESMVNELVARIKESTSKLTDDFEIILVNDGSPDRSWEMIVAECSSDKRVKGINLSRNFGQHFAITAGLSQAKGVFVILMDCDLQDDPSYIPDLYRKAQEGFDIVYTKRSSRNYSFVKNAFSKLFYKTLSWISDFDLDPNIGNYSILSRKAVDAFLKFNDYRRGYLFVLKWIGFKNTSIPIKHSVRAKGRSSYSPLKLISLALNLAISYSDKPLRISIYAGIIFSICSFFGAALVIYKYFTENVLAGWSSTLVILSLIGGLLMIFLGIIGLYISKVFEQTKQRPLFLIQDKENT